MSTIKRIAKNTSVLFISQTLSYIFGFFTLMYSARYLGVESFGVLSFALAFTGIFGVFADLGLRTLVVREVVRDKSLTKKYLGNALSIKIILGIVTFVLTALTVNLLGYSQQTVYIVYLIILYVILNAFSLIFYSIFQAHEKMEYQSIGIILNALLILLGILLVIYYRLDIFMISGIYFVTSAIVLICNLIICAWKFVLPKIEVDLEFWSSKLKEAWPFAITGLSITLYTWIDTILLSLLIGEVAVGFYTAAYRLITVLLVIPVIFNTVIFPIMSKYYVSSKESLQITFEKLFKFMILLGIPLGVGTTILSNKIILLIYGDQYINSVIALQILIWSLVLIFTRSSFERLLEASNKQLIVTKVFFIGVIFNIIVNLIFIPKFSYIGAGIITVLTDLLVLLILIYIVRELGVNISKNTIISMRKIILASTVMGGVIYLLNTDLIISTFIGILVYVIILLILKILDEDEIKMIRLINK